MRQSQEKRTAAPRTTSSLNTLLQILIIIPVALFIKSNTVELFKIPTGSMEPTLYGANDMGSGFGDHILVGRFSYGLNGIIKVPLVNWRFKMPYTRLMLPGMRQPRAGEVVVFENPVDPRIDYIKRCGGTPGDRIRIRNGHLYVNDAIVTNSPATASYVRYTNNGLLADRFDGVRGAVQEIVRREGTGAIKDCVFVNGRPYGQVENEVDRNLASFDPKMDLITSEVRVPSNCFFMLGDNSAHSLDSRYWGFVPLQLVKGKALCVYLPIKRIRTVR
jgi:signal peptidase I